jgi:3-phosphoshikimate 1-carboxyvinyltransferase
MIAEVFGSFIQGRVNAPPSKSAMQRLVAGALLSEGVTKILSPSLCDDSMASMAIAEALGAEITVSDDVVVVKGGFKPQKSEIFCNESGLATRMFTPIAALHNSEIMINGKGSVLNRPLKMMERPMTELGVKISTNNGYLPLKIKGPLRGGETSVDGSVSSQFLTGLLMALPVIQNDSKLIVENLVSKPYIDLTIRILKGFGIEILTQEYRTFNIRGRQKYQPGDFKVEGDWSGAAFLMVMAAIGGEIVVDNIDIYSAQADKAIYEILAMAGAKIKHDANIIYVAKGNLNGFSYDVSDCPDLAPPLTALGLACNGKTIITGTSRLASKESDRGKILETTLTSLGARVSNFKDRIEIEGGKPLKGGRVSAFNDHRIAMTLAAAALLCNSPVVIDGIECVNKSYPEFVNDFGKIGGKIKLL